MPYVPISCPASVPERVRNHVVTNLDLYFADVHWMLCAQRSSPSQSISGMNFSAMIVSFAALGGISRLLYPRFTDDGAAFRGLVESEYFDWPTDSAISDVSAKEGADTFYRYFRNRLVHNLGVAIDMQRQGSARALTLDESPIALSIGKSSDTDDGLLEKIERDQQVPFGPLLKKLQSPPINLYATIAEVFYSYVRRTAERILADQRIPIQSDGWLCHIGL